MPSGVYRISEGRRRAGSGERFKSLMRMLIFLAFAGAMIAVMLNRQFFPFVSTVAESEARNKIVDILEEAVLEEIEAADLKYSDIIRLSYKSDGSIAGLECELPVALRIRSSVAKKLLVYFTDADRMTVSVPLGSVSGVEWLSGRGPTVDIKLVLAHGLRAYIGSDFKEEGINQTLHRVTVCLDVEVGVLTPTCVTTVRVANAYPIAETVIVGDVPDAYTKINRFTDDITETEIDDIYDFGATVK